jgi:hypothetical protein
MFLFYGTVMESYCGMDVLLSSFSICIHNVLCLSEIFTQWFLVQNEGLNWFWEFTLTCFQTRGLKVSKMIDMLWSYFKPPTGGSHLFCLEIHQHHGSHFKRLIRDNLQNHIILYRVHLAWVGFELMLVVIGIGSYKSNYDTIMTAPTLNRILLDVNRFAGKKII